MAVAFYLLFSVLCMAFVIVICFGILFGWHREAYIVDSFI